MLPYDAAFRDYSTRLRDALLTIADVYRISSGEELALRIASARNDILLIRADQETFDGSIPLLEAQELLAGIQLMLTAAACSAIRPRARNRGRRPDAVKEFLAQEVRMGHALREGFAFTILARHDDSRAEELPETSDGKTVLRTYTRRVTTTLASGLAAAHELLKEPSGIDLDDAVERGASVELIDSLEKMSSHPGLQALDISFYWSPIQPRPGEVAGRVILRRPHLQRIGQVRETLSSKQVIEQDEVRGQVVRLERAEDQEEGIVVIDDYLGRTRRRVKVRLSGEDYRTAIRAHEERRPIVATGEVTLEKRSLWLTGPVEVRFPSSGETQDS